MRRFVLVAAAVVTLVSGAGLVAASAAGPAPGGVIDMTVTIRHSRFVPSSIEVPAGATVRLRVENTDPIAHELIVGDQSIQDAHEKGTHAVHGAVPGEVSVAAGEQASTTYTFGAGDVLMGCHLPGHWDYGMRGDISVG